MDLHRSQSIKPIGIDIEYRVSRHQNYEQVGNKMVPKGDPYPVVELFSTDSHELTRIARFSMEEFVELSREVVKVGRELVPAKDGDDA